MRLYNRTAPQEHTVGQLGSNETAPAEPAEGSGKSPWLLLMKKQSLLLVVLSRISSPRGMATRLGVVLGLEPWVYLENPQAALSISGKEADFPEEFPWLCSTASWPPLTEASSLAGGHKNRSPDPSREPHVWNLWRWTGKPPHICLSIMELREFPGPCKERSDWRSLVVWPQQELPTKEVALAPWRPGFLALHWPPAPGQKASRVSSPSPAGDLEKGAWPGHLSSPEEWERT